MSNTKLRLATTGLLLTASIALQGQTVKPLPIEQQLRSTQPALTERESTPTTEDSRNEKLTALAKEIVAKAIIITDNAACLVAEYNKTAKTKDKKMSVKLGPMTTVSIPGLITIEVSTNDALKSVIITYDADKSLQPNQQVFSYKGWSSIDGRFGYLNATLDQIGPWQDIVSGLQVKAVAAQESRDCAKPESPKK
jgi:hypothetical protein